MCQRFRMAKDESGPFEFASISDGYRQYLEPVIFEPWARRLIEFVQLKPGQIVLDVASGTGVVARTAAKFVGKEGQVIASDISPAMLSHVVTGLDHDAAAIQLLECSATELRLLDHSVDVVLCQQGFPFIPDRTAAAREMHRVLRPGGRVGVAVWLSGARLDPFETYAEVLRDAGIAEPIPHAYDVTRFTMSMNEVEETLIAAGFGEIAVTTQELEVAWSSPEVATLGIIGTPFGPAAAALDLERQRRIMETLRQVMTRGDGSAVRPVLTAVLGRGTAA